MSQLEVASKNQPDEATPGALDGDSSAALSKVAGEVERKLREIGVQEDWLRFGKPVAERILDRRTRIESYAPGQVFALVRWASNDYGTVGSTLTIAQAAGFGEPFTTLPQVDPGAQILLSVRSWPKVRQVFALIDAIEDVGIHPCDVAPDHWHHVHNRLAGGMQVRSYSPARHRDWLRRRKLQS